jgi:hypothetical protein
MKRLDVPAGCEALFAHLSGESALRFEMARIAEWLDQHGIDPHEDRERTHGGERLSWRSGYLAGLKQALAVLTGGDATVH